MIATLSVYPLHRNAVNDNDNDNDNETTTVYDVTRPDTFDNLSKWLEEVETYHPGRGREVRVRVCVCVCVCARGGLASVFLPIFLRETSACTAKGWGDCRLHTRLTASGKEGITACKPPKAGGQEQRPREL